MADDPAQPVRRSQWRGGDAQRPRIAHLQLDEPLGDTGSLVTEGTVRLEKALVQGHVGRHYSPPPPRGQEARNHSMSCCRASASAVMAWVRSGETRSVTCGEWACCNRRTYASPWLLAPDVSLPPSNTSRRVSG